MDSAQSERIWKCLAGGESLAKLGLGQVNGRLDLRGLCAPELTLVSKFETPAGSVEKRSGGLTLRGVVLRDLDFSGSVLSGMRFFDCIIENCILDSCVCTDWRLWGTVVSKSSFRAADLRKSALGGVEGTKRNLFREVDFSKADLRQTVYKAADFDQCTFGHCKLAKVDFQGSAFHRCTFEGELNEVLFHSKAYGVQGVPENEMDEVDFRRARLRFVEFRGLNLDEVHFPDDDDHIVIADYPKALDRVLGEVKGRTDTASKKLAAIFAVRRKWVGPRQTRGIINKQDISEMAGQKGLEELLTLLARNQLN